MIKPTKFLNLNSCILNLCTDILIELLKNNSISYDSLYNKLSTKFGSEIKYLFIPSLDFLFLLGKIKYISETDSLELIK
ncbi:ABC-three component system middle component 8 [Clostridium cuniculi]|uniref:ABC-three component system middle component 8 n=1 Tax=Clostridium cuniculi TaxID=2548455 RepID=UPI0010563E6D|nr:ABC-three component system middle component 8 [Clostridium cuniculi]